MCEKDYIWNPRTCTCENDKYLEIIIDESVIMWDELIGVIQSEPTKILPISLNYGKVTCHLDNFCILLSFINYHIAFDNYGYLVLLLPNETLVKTKLSHITIAMIN